ncbi:MAG: hypothetical protein II038_05255, partial [Lachnospiraceae bacterium]|nr:hypothetical protein [Lachnospiraceae bacterium]
VFRIADSDGQERIYHVGDATIKVELSGGDKSHSHECGSSKNFSAKAKTYDSSSLSGAKMKSNESSTLGSGYSWTDGKYGVGSGYVAGFGHGAPDQKGTDADGNEYTIPNPHNCGSFTPGTDITYGPSATISYTITVTFKNATFSHKNYDGVSASAEYFTEHEKVGDGTKLPAHALCGSCCENTLPQIVDTWTQKLRYDTVRFTALRVWKLDNGYTDGMSEIKAKQHGGDGTGIEGGEHASDFKPGSDIQSDGDIGKDAKPVSKKDLEELNKGNAAPVFDESEDEIEDEEESEEEEEDEDVDAFSGESTPSDDAGLIDDESDEEERTNTDLSCGLCFLY